MKLPRNEAFQLFKAIRRGLIYQTTHFEIRAEQRDFTMEDVLEVAENGVMSKRSPKYNPEYDNWTYLVRGKDIDGNKLEIVFVITSDRRVKLITG